MTFYKERSFKETPLGKIPKEWDAVKLKELCEKAKAGGTPLTSNKAYWNGSLPFVKIEDMTFAGKYLTSTKSFISEEGLRNSSTWVVPEDSLLFAMYGSMGKVSINKTPLTTNQAILGIIPHERDYVEFLYYWFSFFKLKWKKYAKPTTQANLTAEILRNSLIPLPSQEERRAITRILNVVDLAVSKSGEVIAKTERLKKGLMQQLLTRGIGHTKYKYSKELGSEVPKDWDVIKYEGANERIFVGIATSSTKYFASEGIPLIRNQNIKEKGIDLNNLTYITKNFAEANKSRMLKENDIITVRTGFPGLSGKVTKEMEGWQTFTTLISRPKLGEFDPDYLVYVLNSTVCKNQISRLKAGLAQQNLNVGAIVNLYVPKPSKNEQIQIAERIRILYEKQRIEEAYFEKLKLIKQGLMNELLTGKVRIKVD
jgi:type I restriction enzyme S subunit